MPGHPGPHRSYFNGKEMKHWEDWIRMTRQQSITLAAEAAWKVTTKFSHPLKRKLKDLWRNMMKRCNDPFDRRWADYGGRGIKVCREWSTDRYKFYAWCLENGCAKHLQIDRKDNDGPYSPENCKFSTRVEQSNNTRKSRFLEWNGKRLTVAQWARELGVRQMSLQHRVDRRWPIDRIFTQPYRKQHAHSPRLSE
jgi:hypothetical protein